MGPSMDAIVNDKTFSRTLALSVPIEPARCSGHRQSKNGERNKTIQRAEFSTCSDDACYKPADPLPAEAAHTHLAAIHPSLRVLHVKCMFNEAL